MQLFISHQSALQYWRCSLASPGGEHVLISADHTPRLAPQEASWLKGTWGIDAPVHVCVPSKNASRHPSTLHCHVQGKPPSGTGFCHLGRTTYVASPELTLAQLASHLLRSKLLRTEGLQAEEMRAFSPALVLAVILCELMGAYRLSASADGYCAASPLIDRARFRQLLERNPRLPGRAVLLAALDYAIEGSASPAETALALFETLPQGCGGMGFAKRPLLNAPVSVSQSHHVALRYPDQLFVDEAWIVEYNGSYHEGERANKDDRRRIELENAGYTVKTINWEQLLTSSALEAALAPLTEAVGRTGRRPSNYDARRRDLRALVFETSGTRHPENRGRLVSAELLPH